MSQDYWRLAATEVVALLRRREASARVITQSVLDRVAAVNPRINALVTTDVEAALASADAADAAAARGEWLGPLHGVPVTIKINIDVAGQATTDGAVALKDNIAQTDSPLVTHLRRAGAVIIGRSNAPAFSLRWFTDNELHGRTLNPFDAAVTPGGSSGGAAAAAATGMGAIHHGNDYGGSIRHPAWCCGVVGLRTTVGRVPAFKGSAPNRIISNQLMSVQGPLTRTVADARLALEVMAQGSTLDPNWVPAPIAFASDSVAGAPPRVAVFKRHAAYDADPTVVAAIEQAAEWLQAAGYDVIEAEPPHFEEGAELWRTLVYDDLRRAGLPAIELMGDTAVKRNLEFVYHGRPGLDRDAYLDALSRRLAIAREWSQFFDDYPVLLMPNSWSRQFAVDADTVSVAAMNQLIRAQSPLLGTAMMGLPGLAVPTGVVAGLPVGVQLVSHKFREDLLLRVGADIERAAQFSALPHLAPDATRS
ncbi:MAG: amidase [Burkholderiales bacterium]|nr:amidase [Burkholderiales bacterium]